MNSGARSRHMGPTYPLPTPHPLTLHPQVSFFVCTSPCFSLNTFSISSFLGTKMEVSSVDDNGLDLGLCLSLRKDSRILVDSSCSSSSSSSSCSVNVSKTGIKRTAPVVVHSVSPNSTSVVGWPPIRKAQRMPILANRNKSEHETNGNIHLSVKVNMDGTLIGRKVDLYAHTSYEMLAHTLEDMFYGTRLNTKGIGSSRLLNGTSEFVLTYEDKDGDCMLVGDVPWQLRILRNPKMHN